MRPRPVPDQLRIPTWLPVLLLVGCARTPSSADHLVPVPGDSRPPPRAEIGAPGLLPEAWAAFSLVAQIEALARQGTAQVLLDRVRPIHDDRSGPRPRRFETFARQVARRQVGRGRALLDFHERFLAADHVRRLDHLLRRAELLLDPDPGALDALARDLARLALATADSDRAAEAWFLLGEIHVDRGDEEAARLAFASVLRAQPDHGLAPAAYLALARSFFEQGNLHRREPNGEPRTREFFARAGAVSSRFAALHPDHSEAKASRLEAGSAFLWAGRWQKAYDHLHPFVAADPEGLPAEDAALQAQAMYWLGAAFQSIAELPPERQPARLRGMYTDNWHRASILLLHDLIRDHPESIWAERARGPLVVPEEADAP